MKCLPRLGVGTRVKMGIRLLYSSSLVEGCVVPVTMVTRNRQVGADADLGQLCNVDATTRG
jgi:hypothetical protein